MGKYCNHSDEIQLSSYIIAFYLNTMMNIRDPQRGRHVLICRASVSLSDRSLIYQADSMPHTRNMRGKIYSSSNLPSSRLALLTPEPPQHYQTPQVNHLQNRKRLREQVTRQQQDIQILTRKSGNNGRSPPPPPLYLHETPENQADQYHTVFNRQHKTYLNHGRGHYGINFYEKLRSILMYWYNVLCPILIS
jgi:hypothetical protein